MKEALFVPENSRSLGCHFPSRRQEDVVMARAASNVHSNRQKDISIVRDRVSHIRPDSNFIMEKLQGEKQTIKTCPISVTSAK